jgi:acetyl-CoA carboxylase biotin carboxylase subunit
LNLLISWLAEFSLNTSKPLFKKILIANRGEIAVRLMRACQELGIQTVAVYSAVDRTALHTSLADEAVFIGPPSASESYLRQQRIIDAAVKTDCQAIHPGYGFLAENADFAEAVSAAGLTFIGPGPEAIRLMGSKTTARQVMQMAGVPVVPGYHPQSDDPDELLLAAAEKIGYPLLVKATAGGGGKGMRLVEAAENLPEALQSARREALNAFGDGTIYLEKFLAQPHHVEFQIFGDAHGNLVHLFERECSVQRRHQKIIEETPSPLLDEATRRQMAEAAVAAARAVAYVNAGTVEFLVDGQHNFYFLEMNTRLQVEHPLTEMVTGIDLVKLQLRVAAGESLPCSQEELTRRGHAIECRIYAEDPANDFLPDTGRILQVVEPQGPGIRVDSGIGSGDIVTLHYDPLLAKLIVLAENRQEALRKMAWALDRYTVLGLTTNIPFLSEVIAHEAFGRGQTTTDFVERYFSGWQAPAPPPPDLALIAAALAEMLEERLPLEAEEQREGDVYSPWTRLKAFRVGR